MLVEWAFNASSHVPDCKTRSVLSCLLSPRAGYRFSFAALTLFLGCETLQTAVADGDTRTISLHHVHTNEDITVTFKRNGRYDDEALKKVDWLLRDWRLGQEIKTDPQLLDLLWEVQREVGAKQPIHVICGYRAPQTNAMLRRRSGGVAQFSQHTLGKAMDFFIPGVPLEDLRAIGLRLQRGGIGFYPTSGSPFVHLDVGSIRHWPSMSREELVRIFPDGRTVHVPSDGHPLPGYALALAEVERRGNEPSAVSLAAARNTGVLNGQAASGSKSAGNALAKFFGFGRKEVDEDVETTATIASAPASTPAITAAKTPAVTLAAALPAKGRPVAPVAATAPARVAPPSPAPEARVEMASANASVTANLSPWPAPPPIDRVSPELALAYAAQPDAELTSRPAPPRRLAPLTVASIPPATSLAPKQQLGIPTEAVSAPVLPSGRFDDPWLRAAIVAPDLHHFMTADLSGPPNSLSLNVFMQKPSSTVTVAFSDDANFGLAADRFSGQAVVFVNTTSFNARTASLR